MTRDRSITLSVGASTLHHIREALDFIRDDLEKMDRWTKDGWKRSGGRARGITSILGIPGYPKETIILELPQGAYQHQIRVTHEIGDHQVTYAHNWTHLKLSHDSSNLPQSIIDGAKGQPLKSFVDLSHTSLTDLVDAPISSIHPSNHDRPVTYIYVEAPIHIITVRDLLDGA